MANNSPALTGNSQPQHQAAAAVTQQQQQCGGGGGATKPAVSGKQGNVLPLWGNEKTMNLNPMILTNILSSPYFKVQLYELKTYHEVVDEIYFKVTHVEPWEKGSRKTAGQTGMCGGVSRSSRCWNRRHCFYSILPSIQIIYPEVNSKASDGSHNTYRLSIYQSPWIYVYKVYPTPYRPVGLV
uniref:Pre-mRNA-splicing factor 38B n=1 Tax=Mus musculus TaxID=10090 RepID=A0A0G2JEW4_MOUSE